MRSICSIRPTLLLAFIPLMLTTRAFSQTASTYSFSAPHKIPTGAPNTFSPYAFVSGDVTGDGKTDLVVSLLDPIDDKHGGTTTLELLKGKGDGTFTRSPIPGETKCTDCVFADNVLLLKDLNGDGHTDLVAVNPGQFSPNGGEQIDGTVHTYFGDGHGGFHLNESLQIGVDFASAVLGDFNRDGKPDIAVLSAFEEDLTSTLCIFLNHGNGTFTAGPTYTFLEFEENLVVGDFDGDGKLDLAFDSSFESNVLHFMKGLGNGSFKEGSTYVFDSSPFSLAAADLNHDGRSEIVVGLAAVNKKGASPRVATLFFRGTRFFWHSATFTPQGVGSLTFADLNKDGKLDLVATGGARSVYTMNGDGKGGFASPQVFLGLEPIGSIVATPLTSGGKLDLIFDFYPFAFTQQPYLGLLLNQGK
jgi:hypothetical protein